MGNLILTKTMRSKLKLNLKQKQNLKCAHYFFIYIKREN
jgi:hypothetical protein